MLNKKTLSYKKAISICMTAILLFAIGYMIIGTKSHVQYNGKVVFSFYFNILFFGMFLLKSMKKYTYSFDLMFWLFSLFFFGLAPLAQYFLYTYSWGVTPNSDEIILINAFILFFSFCFCLGKSLSRLKIRYNKQRDTGSVIYVASSNRIKVLLIITILITLYHLVFIGFPNLLIASTSENDQLDSTSSLLLLHGLKNISLFVWVSCFLDCKRKKHLTISAIIAGVCFLISCFPTGLSRNMMASFYAGIFLVVFDKQREKRWITYVIFFGLVLLFPAANVFRNLENFTTGNIWESMLENVQKTYVEAHYDAHQMFISIYQYVKKYGVSYGKQLLGALLFFVPRSIWPGKPYGSGQTVFEALKQHEFTNVSAPLVAESYINFGILGIALFGTAIGLITTKMDRAFWREKNRFSPFCVLYPFLILKFFFMLRGDLMSTWAYTFAQLVVGVFILKFVMKKKKVRQNN